MFFRVLFLLLLALNVGVVSWLRFAQQQPVELPAADAGVPRLLLLSERDRVGDANSAELAAAPESPSELGRDNCKTLGPFATQADVRQALNLLTPQVLRIQFRDARAVQARGYWVFLPALASREQALNVARQLSAKGVRDYYVVTAGDQQNTISLGLFRDQGNAEKRRSEIVAQGFDAQLIARTEELPVYWVDYAENPAQPVNWRARLARFTELKEQAIDCF